MIRFKKGQIHEESASISKGCEGLNLHYLDSHVTRDATQRGSGLEGAQRRSQYGRKVKTPSLVEDNSPFMSSEPSTPLIKESLHLGLHRRQH